MNVGVSSRTSLFFLGFLGSENYILYISSTIFHDFYILLISFTSFCSKVSFEIVKLSWELREAFIIFWLEDKRDIFYPLTCGDFDLWESR